MLATMNKRKKIKLLSFDLDNTLWPCKPTIIAAEKKLYTWMQQQVPKITQSFDIEQLRMKRMRFLEQRPDLAHDMSNLRIESLKSLALEMSLSADWVMDAFEVFYEARQQVTLYDDVVPVLDELQTQYRLSALTNGNASIEKTGVAHWFEFSVSAADVGQQKPHPQFFETLLQLAGLDACEVLHIGDDPHRDIQGAFDAGIRSVWLNRAGQPWPYDACQADQQIESLRVLPEILHEMQAN